MEIDLIWVGLGIAVAGYFIGDGLKNFKNPEAKGLGDMLDEDDEHELIKESEVHSFMGISKEDAKDLVKDYPEIPHVLINKTVYYPQGKLRQWLKDLGE